jgi:hypothetical protein
MQFKNISPAGPLELPLIGRVVDAGETIDLPPHLAAHLEGQPDVWQPVPAKPTATKPTESDQKKEPIE